MSIEDINKLTPKDRQWGRDLDQEAEKVQAAADLKRKQEGGKTAADEKLDSYFELAGNRLQEIEKRFNNLKSNTKISRMGQLKLNNIEVPFANLTKLISQMKTWPMDEKRNYILTKGKPFDVELTGMEHVIEELEKQANK